VLAVGREIISWPTAPQQLSSAPLCHLGHTREIPVELALIVLENVEVEVGPLSHRESDYSDLGAKLIATEQLLKFREQRAELSATSPRASEQDSSFEINQPELIIHGCVPSRPFPLRSSNEEVGG